MEEDNPFRWGTFKCESCGLTIRVPTGDAFPTLLRPKEEVLRDLEREKANHLKECPGPPRSLRDHVLPGWATQYYVAGRLAALAGLWAVSGNLLHHAVETYLKTALYGLVGATDLKQEYRHDLEKLWARFKLKEAAPSLDRFDWTIHSLDEFEELRYPDQIPHSHRAITWQESYPAKWYEVFISHVDSLIIEILDRASVNPKDFTTSIGPSGQEALRHENLHAARWL